MHFLIRTFLILWPLSIWFFSFAVFLVGWPVIGLLSIFYILRVDVGFINMAELRPYRQNIKWILLGPLTPFWRFIVLPLCFLSGNKK